MQEICSKIEEAKSFLTNLWNLNPSMQPKVGLILGSGLSSVAEKIKSNEHYVCSFNHIPHFKKSNVEGHKAEIIFGKLNQTDIIVLSGRLHYYEGHSPYDVVFPIRLLASLGVKKLLLTNAAGAIRDEFEPGDFMCINDHINLTGQNPLIGPNEAKFGPRFVDLSEAYDKELINVGLNCAKKLNIKLYSGVYAGLTGPTYETPAEIRMLKTLGADAAGMSTVFETIAAKHLGLQVFGISCLTNKAAGLSSSKITHEEVMQINAIASVKLSQLLEEIVASL